MTSLDELIELCRKWAKACEATHCTDTTTYRIAADVLNLFGSIPDWPCGWSRAVVADPTTENWGGAPLHVRAMNVTYDPDEAIAVGLDLFLCGLNARATATPHSDGSKEMSK